MTKSNLFTLAYTSESQIPPEKFNQEIAKIIKVAQKENMDRDITGVLLYMNNRFLQILEGPQDHIYTLMQNIEADTRHKNVETLIEKHIRQRGFGQWNMEFYELDNDDKFSLENLSQIRKGLGQNTLASGREILTFYNSLLK